MAAISKSFVIKNGLEVNTNLIFADAPEGKVGIGTTNPEYLLHVKGGIGATDSFVSGISTVINELRVGTGGTIFSVIAGPAGVGQSVGVGTARPAFLLDVRSPVSTGQTALYVQGDVRVTGDLNVDDISITNLNVTGVSTFVGFATFRNNIFVAGISTFVGFSTFNDYVFIQDGLNVTGTGATLASVNVTGLTTIRNTIISGITTITNTTDSTTFNNGALVIDGGLGVEKSVNIGGNLDVDGNITIGGSFFSLQSQEVFISNKDIILGFTTTVTPNDDTANHAGIAIASTEGSPLVSFTASGINTLPDTYKQMMWFRSGTLGFSTDIFGFNYGLAIGTTTVSNGVRLAVGSNVTVTDTTVNAPSGNFTNLTGTAGTITNLTGTAGTITTFNSTSGTITNLNVTGISTLGTVKVSSGIITATSGIVTYYGDGQYLDLTNNSSTGIGIGTTGGVVGYGITFLDLKGAGVSTTFYSSSTGIATIFFEGGGGSGSIGIGSTFTALAANGDLFYHINYGKIFVYYDEVVLGIGGDAYWVDAAPFNVGIITALTNVSFYPGSAVSPSMYFVGDSQTGFFSPGAGQFTVVSSGSSVLNVNASGIRVTGIATATDFDALSDENYKKNVSTVNDALNKVEQLRGVSFDWKENGRSSYGVIAQELQKVLPELVHGDNPKTVNYNGIIGVLIEAIKELKKEVEELKSV